MADHSKPVLTDNYTNVLDQVRGRFEDQAKGFDPANTSATNIQTNTIRWTSASNKWQKWNGTGWNDLSNLYAINISGNAGTVTGGVYATGNQTIGGTKTFSSTIQGSVSGNSGTVTNGVYTVGNQTVAGVKTFSDNTIVNGNLGLGVGAPSQRLDVSGRGVFTVPDATFAAAFNASNGNLRVSPYVDASFGTNLTAFSAGYAGYGPMSLDASRLVFYTNGNERLRVDSNGKLILSAASQGIQFADNTTQTTAYRGPATTFINQTNRGVSYSGNNQVVTFSSNVVYDLANSFNTGTNEYTAPYSGFVKVTVSSAYFVTNAPTVNWVDFLLTRDGAINSIPAPEYRTATSGPAGRMSMTFLVGVQAGQKIQLRVSVTGGSAFLYLDGISFEMLT
jgi:hypothetical protein